MQLIAFDADQSTAADRCVVADAFVVLYTTMSIGRLTLFAIDSYSSARFLIRQRLS